VAAGDAFIITEATSHGVLPWRPAERNKQRRVLALRYTPHGPA
jgi:hypothetical protein